MRDDRVVPFRFVRKQCGKCGWPIILAHVDDDYVEISERTSLHGTYTLDYRERQAYRGDPGPGKHRLHVEVCPS